MITGARIKTCRYWNETLKSFTDVTIHSEKVETKVYILLKNNNLPLNEVKIITFKAKEFT